MPLTHPQARRINLRDFSKEILTDLDALIQKKPLGVTMSDLIEYYGESSPRVARAIEILVSEDRIERRRKASNTIYIFPKGYHLPRPYPELSHLQWRLLQLLQQSQEGDHFVHSNYSRLAEDLHASIGGTKAALNRLQDLNHIRIQGVFDERTRRIPIEVLTQPSHDDPYASAEDTAMNDDGYFSQIGNDGNDNTDANEDNEEA